MRWNIKNRKTALDNHTNNDRIHLGWIENVPGATGTSNGAKTDLSNVTGAC
jgi:hypothetical protein